MATISVAVHMCECRDCGNRHFPKKAVAAKPDRECVVCLKTKPYEQFYTGGAPSGRCHDCKEKAKTHRVEMCSVCRERFWILKSIAWYLGIKCERCERKAALEALSQQADELGLDDYGPYGQMR